MSFANTPRSLIASNKRSFHENNHKTNVPCVRNLFEMMLNQNQCRVGILQDSKSIFLWYFLFGILHETSHIFCWLGLAWWHGYDFTLLGAPHVLAIEVILGRQCSLPSLHGGLDGSVRHAGWISSCFFLIVLTILLRYKELNKNILLVAFLTALEAITTDLIGLNPAINLGTTYFCGNFGIIFLNEHWFKNRQTEAEALDMLQQMIEGECHWWIFSEVDKVIVTNQRHSSDHDTRRTIRWCSRIRFQQYFQANKRRR